MGTIKYIPILWVASNIQVIRWQLPAWVIGVRKDRVNQPFVDPVALGNIVPLLIYKIGDISCLYRNGTIFWNVHFQYKT